MKKDKCVVCGRNSPYDKNTNIHRRKFYVEGAGQLCKDCWDTIYKAQN